NRDKNTNMRYFQFFIVGLLFFQGNAVLAQSKVQEETLEELMALKTEMTKKNELEHRYVIQLGSFSRMRDAEDVLTEFKKGHPDVFARLEYESPNYKAWVGSFTSRLSAERLYTMLKKEFKSAFVFKPR